MKAQVYGLLDDALKGRTVWRLRKVDALGLALEIHLVLCLRSLINYWIFTSDVKKSCSAKQKTKEGQIACSSAKFQGRRKRERKKANLSHDEMERQLGVVAMAT